MKIGFLVVFIELTINPPVTESAIECFIMGNGGCAGIFLKKAKPDAFGLCMIFVQPFFKFLERGEGKNGTIVNSFHERIIVTSGESQGKIFLEK